MAKLYKEIGMCQMCKKRFVFEKELYRAKHWPKAYCPICCRKYIGKKDRKN